MSSNLHPTLQIPVYDVKQLSQFKEQAIAVTPSANIEVETAIYRSVLSPSTLLLSFPTITTVNELVNFGVEKYSNNAFLGTRAVTPQGEWSTYQFKTFKEVDDDRRSFGAGLVHLHNPSKSWFLGIFSVNRYEWVVADYGAQMYSIPNVALYDTLGAETSEFILNHAEVPVLVTSLDKVSDVLLLAPKCPNLKIVIVLEAPFKPLNSTIPLLKKWGAQLGVQIFTFKEVLELGAKHPSPVRPPKGEDIYALSYTSGTTGNPKAVVLTHSNMVSTIRALRLTLDIKTDDLHVSYLPLAHIFERVAITMMTVCGASVGFFRGDVSLLIEDIGVLRPTLFISVPRLFNRIHDKIVQGALSSPLKAALFKKALSDKKYYLEKEGSLTHAFWDPLVFNKVKKVLGGRVRYLLSASAPLAGDVIQFLRVATGAQFMEAYGQTESCGGLTLTWPGDYSMGHVGSVTPNSEMKLVSVPEMGYHARDLKGEVWVRGNGVFRGYLGDTKKTDETITQDGWLMTGDIGTLDKQGRLSIIDRKKNIFKLAQAPEKLENVFLKSFFVAQLYVHGDSLQSELVAIVVPDQEYIIEFAISNGVLPSSTVRPEPPKPNAPLHPLVKEICKSKLVSDAILKDLAVLAKAESLRGFEVIKAIHLHPDLFTVEDGLMTPTFKVKRNVAESMFRPQIDKMYKDLKVVAKL